MTTSNLNDLAVFMTVAQERSFTRAAARLGLSRSALSHCIRGLEAKLGTQLLIRTTRSVSTTDAGSRLLNVVAPRINEIEMEIGSIVALRDKPGGTVRITADDHSIKTLLWPKLAPLLREYPDIHIELSVDYGLTDIAAQHFDAGIRLGDSIDKDMIAVRIAPDMRMAAVAAPAYLASKPPLLDPRALTEHSCLNLRLPTHGGLYAWEFEKEGQRFNVKVQGQATFNNSYLMLQAALDGVGLTYGPLNMMQPYLDNGALAPVLEDWWPLFPGYHLYYANRRQISPALSLVIEFLRNR
ncbi:LysR family transcriptional regulator [Pseudomonas endophytica]|uniref:LysR family transcriptional regulator n=1 Tax=Pseudomonas endophytica TaxID=1563157 RepID=A0A0Q0SRH4_9PSED|nr:LysR family transcriptional regulator [Pseudomonas endophytica]KQB54711.1 LysR family transcriptional regulator [Pseudomonas endophytica]